MMSLVVHWQDLCVDAADDRLFEGVIKAAWQGSQ